jgi:putative transposase
LNVWLNCTTLGKIKISHPLGSVCCHIDVPTFLSAKLRDIQSNLESQQEKLYHLGAKRIARSTLARLNEEQPASLYQQLFTQLLQRCENSKTAHKFRFKNPLYSLDASHIDLSLSLCAWAKVHESKASIKLSVGLNHSNTIPEFVALGDGIENDMVQGRAFKFPAGSIIVFDKGYVDYQWFAQLTLQNVSFVTATPKDSLSS